METGAGVWLGAEVAGGTGVSLGATVAGLHGVNVGKGVWVDAWGIRECRDLSGGTCGSGFNANGYRAIASSEKYHSYD